MFILLICDFWKNILLFHISPFIIFQVFLKHHVHSLKLGLAEILYSFTVNKIIFIYIFLNFRLYYIYARILFFSFFSKIIKICIIIIYVEYLTLSFPFVSQHQIHIPSFIFTQLHLLSYFFFFNPSIYSTKFLYFFLNSLSILFTTWSYTWINSIGNLLACKIRSCLIHGKEL